MNLFSEFGDKLEVEIKGLEKLTDAVSSLKQMITELSSFTPEQILIAVVVIFFTAGFSFYLGKQVAKFITWIPVRMFRGKSK